MPKPYKDADTLRRLYHERGLSLRNIADRFDTSHSTIRYWFEKYGIDRRKPKRERLPCFRQTGGYERVETSVDGTTEYVQIHRLVAVAEHGFDSVAGNDTHHSNGVPWDNRPSNIEVLPPDVHRREHERLQARDTDGKFA